jgi:hypothetical protein
MKTACIRGLLVLVLCAASQPALWAQSAPSASELRELHASFNALFQAMKDGDVAVIEQYFSGQMSSEYKVLLEQNRDYPAFLRNFYRGATFSVAGVTPTPEGDMIVSVAIQLAGGSRSVTRLHAKRFEGTAASWKVTGVVKEGRTTRNK